MCVYVRYLNRFMTYDLPNNLIAKPKSHVLFFPKVFAALGDAASAAAKLQ